MRSRFSSLARIICIDTVLRPTVSASRDFAGDFLFKVGHLVGGNFDFRFQAADLAFQLNLLGLAHLLIGL